MTKSEIMTRLRCGKIAGDYSVELAIDQLNHAERIEIRNAAAAEGLKVPSNLYFDYELQQPIE